MYDEGYSDANEDSDADDDDDKDGNDGDDGTGIVVANLRNIIVARFVISTMACVPTSRSQLIFAGRIWYMTTVPNCSAATAT